MAIKHKKRSNEVVLSIVTPAFNEARNLPRLYARIRKAMDRLGLKWEWIVVDDHSMDRTYRTMEGIARKDRRVKALRFARNSGSHLALACGLREANGRCAVGMAADMQDPPETIGELVERWKKGAQVVWAVREKREGESLTTRLLARFYYFVIRYGLRMRQVPPSGADYFLLDGKVLGALARAKVKNASLLLLISSLPFRQDFIVYTKKERLFGRSGWSLGKKIKLFLDSISMFSEAPVVWVKGIGGVLTGIGVLALALHSNDLVWLRIASLGTIFMGFFLLTAGIYWQVVLRRKPRGPEYKVEKRTFHGA